MDKAGLNSKEKISYGLGAVGKDMVYMLSASYILYYYQDIIGVNAVAMGVILLCARIFDAFNDPVMGIIVAKTRTRWGKFRPWLFIGTIINAVVLYMMFSAPPSMDGKGMVAYAAITYILWGITYTMMDIPYWSMIPAFTRGEKEREGLTTLARSCAGVGSAIITIITMICVPALGRMMNAELTQFVDKYNDVEDISTLSIQIQAELVAARKMIEMKGFSVFALIVAIFFVIFITITCMNIKEKSTVNMETATVGQMFKALLGNDQAMVVVASIVLINCSIYTTSNLLIYFFKYDIAGVNWNDNYVLFSSFGGAIQILSMMILYPLLRKIISTMKVFYLSMAMAIGGYLILFVMTFNGKVSVYGIMFPGFLIFAGAGMLTVLTTVFLAGTVDYGEKKNGRRDESIIFSMQTFVVKLASGISAMIASVCLTLSNISNDTGDAIVVSENINFFVLRATMTIVPIIGFVFALIVFKNKYILYKNNEI